MDRRCDERSAVLDAGASCLDNSAAPLVNHDNSTKIWVMLALRTAPASRGGLCASFAVDRTPLAALRWARVLWSRSGRSRWWLDVGCPCDGRGARRFGDRLSWRPLAGPCIARLKLTRSAPTDTRVHKEFKRRGHTMRTYAPCSRMRLMRMAMRMEDL